MPVASLLKLPTEVRRASLVEAALALAAERSPADVTTAQLAQAIGVTQGAVFRHFESKEAIWLAVLDGASARLLDSLQAAAALHTQHPLDALQAVFEAHVAFVMAHPGMPRLVFQELQRPQDTPLKARVRQMMHSYRQLIQRLLQNARHQGQLAPGTDLQAASVLFMGSIQGLVMQTLVNGDVASIGTQARGVFHLLRTGLSGHQPSHSSSPLPRTPP
jgi:TetR/AcrR family transcriptional regulator